jgi:DNA-directed RNA polymerase specialized sigma24 family protein
MMKTQIAELDGQSTLQVEGRVARAAGMQTLEQAGNYAVALYRLAFIVTGDRGRSLDATLEALESHDGASSSSPSSMPARLRRTVIAKALAGISGDLAASARRTASQNAEKTALPSHPWVLAADTTRVQIESALLAIDAFPRGALLLTVFEGVSVEDAAVLLNGDRDLVRKAQFIGLRQLTRNLAKIQGWTPAALRSSEPMREMQHA